MYGGKRSTRVERERERIRRSSHQSTSTSPLGEEEEEEGKKKEKEEEEGHETKPDMNTNTTIQTLPIHEDNTSIGVQITGIGGGPVTLARRLQNGDENMARIVAEALRKSLVVLIRNEGGEKPGTLSPERIRIIHERVHAARFPGLVLREQPARSGWTTRNIRGSSFPGGYTETQLLGTCDQLDDLYGLSGSLEETAHWTHTSGQFHPDGAFDGGAAPLIVGMTCEEAPTEAPAIAFKTFPNGRFGAHDDWEKEEPVIVSCPAGATLFFPTLVSQVNPSLLERARRMRCAYIESFARILPDKWPVMSASALTPTTNSPIAEMRERASSGTASSADEQEDAYRSFWCERQSTFEGGGGGTQSERAPYVHRLVQHDPMGEDFVVVHSLCLDHLEETCPISGEWRPLSWRESQAFLEALLRPASQKLLAVDWRPGDLCLWDNLRTLHSVTPRDAYELVPKARRVMTRTSMRPAENVLH